MASGAAAEPPGPGALDTVDDESLFRNRVLDLVHIILFPMILDLVVEESPGPEIQIRWGTILVPWAVGGIGGLGGPSPPRKASSAHFCDRP